MIQRFSVLILFATAWLQGYGQPGKNENTVPAANTVVNTNSELKSNTTIGSTKVAIEPEKKKRYRPAFKRNNRRKIGKVSG